MFCFILLKLLTLIPCVNTASNMTGDCDFEDESTCSWINENSADQFDWTLERGRTPSSMTGPDGDHTTGKGRYLYIETSSPRRLGDVARLLSPRMIGPQCMIFWYHMYGSNIGQLQVHVNSTHSFRLLWFKNEEQGNKWHKAQITILENEEYQVQIYGVRGSSFQGDAAIDDISFHRYPCQNKESLSLYVYADTSNHGLLTRQLIPSAAPQVYQYRLQFSQEMLNQSDDIYILQKARTGLRISRPVFNSRHILLNNGEDFFFSSKSRHEKQISVYVIESESVQTVFLHNVTKQCNSLFKVSQLYALSKVLLLNHAAGSPVSQSSQELEYPPELAVDGNPDSCSKTLKQDNPWLEINLKGLSYVYKVYVSSRHSCSHGNTLPKIGVTLLKGSTAVICQTTDQRAMNTGSRVFLCQPPIRALKIHINHNGSQAQLSICEITVNILDSINQLRGVRSEIWFDISPSPKLEFFLNSPKRFYDPNSSKVLSTYIDDGGVLDDYGQRLTAFIQTPIAGNYTFYAMCDDQCRVWLRTIKMFSDVSFVEDLDNSEQEKMKLADVTTYTGYNVWDKYPGQVSGAIALDFCSFHMVEGLVKDSQGAGFLGVGWKMPNDRLILPLALPEMFWMLPGLAKLDVSLLNPKSKNLSFKVGQSINMKVLFRLCCHGFFCPPCPKSVKIHILGNNLILNSSLYSTCEWYSYSTTLSIASPPGFYDIAVSETTRSIAGTQVLVQTVSQLEVKSRVVQSCFHLHHSCSWFHYAVPGGIGWKVKLNQSSQAHYFEIQGQNMAWLQSTSTRPRSLFHITGLCLKFSFRMSNESSKLKVLKRSILNRTLVWSLRGMQGIGWIDAAVPWPEDAIGKIFIEGKSNSNGSISLTNIRLATEKCSTTPSHARPGYSCKSNEFRCDNGMCVKSSLRCDGDYACVDKSDEKDCACRSSQFKCPDGRCLDVIELCNGVTDCSDGSDEKSCEDHCGEKRFSCFDGTCIPWSSTCDGVFDCQDGSDEPDICASLQCPLNDVRCLSQANNTSSKCQHFRGPCDFENGLCGLKIVNQPGYKKWQFNSGSTPTVNTGPSVDHTTLTVNGSYLYIEASDLNNANKASLQSDWLKYEGTTCLRFWYHMWGRHVGDLSVYVMTNETVKHVWSRSGSAGHEWRFGQAPIQSEGRIFRFEIRSLTGPGKEGDVAIDDIDLLDQPCETLTAQINPNCHFMKGFCQWQSNGGWEVDSSRVFSNIPFRQGIVQTNLEFTGIPEMHSPSLDFHNGYKCLRFWFHIGTTNGIRLGTLKLYTLYSNKSRSLVWSTNKVTRSWTYVQLQLTKTSGNRLLFTTSMPFKRIKQLIALDDIILTKEDCQPITSFNEKCLQRTTSNDCCVFPFVYKNKCYMSCIGDGAERLWCSITDNYDRDKMWGSCHEDRTKVKGSGPAVDEPCVVRTSQGPCCTFPFIYRGRSYQKCITYFHFGPWCSLTGNYDRDLLWGDCLILGSLRYRRVVNSKECKKKTTDGRCCVFPFIYRGKKYFKCVTFRHDRPWCSLTPSYDKHKTWGSCSGYPNPDNCASVYGNKGSPSWTDFSSSDSSVILSTRANQNLTSFEDTVNISLGQQQDFIKAGLFEVSFNESFPSVLVQNTPDLSSFTACAWIKTRDQLERGRIFHYIYDCDNRKNVTGFGLFNHHRLRVRISTFDKNTTASVNDGHWHHLCLVWNSKGGVYQMYKDGSFVDQRHDIHGLKKIPGGGSLLIGGAGFHGSMSGLNIWSLPMGRDEIKYRAVGCNIEKGDINSWPDLRRILVLFSKLTSPPSCLDINGEGFNIIKNRTTSYMVDARLRSNSTLRVRLDDGNTQKTGMCIRFRYRLIGKAAMSLKIYKSESVNTIDTKQHLQWVSSKRQVPGWLFGSVSMTTLRPFTVVAKGIFGSGRGAVGIAGYFIKPGYCSEFTLDEERACQLNMTNQSGGFSSPFYPDPYPSDIDCRWQISRPPGQVIHLSIHSFQLENSQSCTKDYVTVHDGWHGDRKSLGKFCGDNFPLFLETSSSHLIVVFKTDELGGTSGFNISYTSHKVTKDDSDVCIAVEDCPSSCSCSFTQEDPKRITVVGEALTVIPRKMPQNTAALMFGRNRITKLKDNSFSQMPGLQYIDLSYNRIMNLQGVPFQGLGSLLTLNMKSNFISSLKPGVFNGLNNLQNLDLSNNLLEDIRNDILDPATDLQVLSLRSNRIRHIENKAFKLLMNLTHLYLQNNRLTAMSKGVFQNLGNLEVLYLSNNKIKVLNRDSFRGLRSLRILHLDKNNIKELQEDTFKDLQKLRVLKLDRFVFCCYAIKSIEVLRCQSPKSAFSNCDDLMKNKVLRVCIWILGILALLGNVGVIAWRMFVNKNNQVHSFLLTNLAVADLLMGVYLLIVAVKDVQFKGIYFKHDLQWRSSQLCQFAGALSVISSEVSVLILATLTADRFVCIVFPLKFIRLKMKSAVAVVTVIWMTCLLLSILPIVVKDYFYDFDWQEGFYGRSAVCLPLQLSGDRLPGWEYSVAIFIALNFVAFTFILVAYLVMFWKVKTVGKSARSSHVNTESAMARRIVFIVITDFCCWMPVIIIGILSLLGIFKDPEKQVYVWIAVFVLPVNSSINPILYTFSTRSCRRRNSVEVPLMGIMANAANRIGIAISRGRSRGESMDRITDIPMTNMSKLHSSALDKKINRRRVKNLMSKSPLRGLQIKEQASVFKGEFSPSVGFFIGRCSDSKGRPVFLLKVFASNQRMDWEREVEVLERIEKDGGHPNIIKHLWHSEANKLPSEIDRRKLVPVKSGSLLVCFEFPSSNTLEEYLNKLGASLDPHLLLAIATDLINALRHLERYSIVHNHVTASSVIIQQCLGVPPVKAILGGFGKAVYIGSLKKLNNRQTKDLTTDVNHYGVLLDQLLVHCHDFYFVDRVKDISDRCKQDINRPTPSVLRSLLEEIWDELGTWDTML